MSLVNNELGGDVLKATIKGEKSFDLQSQARPRNRSVA
jgi:hypothetical protein